MKETWGDLARQLLWEINPQDNLHGTPYTFNKFDNSKWLTGEGFDAHGAGNYSADWYSTAQKYNPGEYITLDVARNSDNIPINLKDSYQLSNNMKVSKDEIVAYLQKALRENRKIVDEYLTYSMVDEIPEAKNVLDNLQDYKTIKTKHIGNTYKVNVPNENFMLNLSKPLNEQSVYIQKALENFYNSKDIPASTKDIIKYLDIDEVRDTRNLYEWLAGDLDDGSTGKRMSVGKKRASKLLNKYGILGNRVIGNTDGPINVTFSDKNIKMANTPLQQITNRIPTQTLGKMAKKLMESPAVRIGGKLLEGSATPLMILDMLNLQGMDPRAVLDKNYRNKLIQQNRNRIY